MKSSEAAAEAEQVQAMPLKKEYVRIQRTKAERRVRRNAGMAERKTARAKALNVLREVK